MDLVRTIMGNLIVASRRYEATQMFSSLPDRRLRDLGLERDDIPGHVDAAMPWLSRDSGRLSHAAKPSLQGLG